MKTHELEGVNLRIAAALALGYKVGEYEDSPGSLVVQTNEGRIKFISGGTVFQWLRHGCWDPTTHWEQCGILLDELSLNAEIFNSTCAAMAQSDYDVASARLKTVICRVFCQIKLGSEIDLSKYAKE